MTTKTKPIVCAVLTACLFTVLNSQAVVATGQTNATSTPKAKIETAAKTNAAATTTTNAAKAQTDLFADAVVAKGKGFEIKRSELDESILSIKTMAAARGQVIPSAQIPTLERQVLEYKIQSQLLLSTATDADRAKGKEQFLKGLQVIKTNVTLEEDLNRSLRIQGISRAKWEQQLIEQATIIAALERELKVNVTDEDAKKYYDSHPSKFEQPEMVRASHILLMTRDPNTGTPLDDDQQKAKRKQMENILKRAKAGEDFAKLAKEYSEDPGSKDNGGEYTFPRGQMVPEFEAAAFSLNTNQISDIIATQFGYHIIKLSEKIPAKTIEFAKVADDVKEMLRQQAVQKQLPDYVAKLKKDANVEILDEKLKAVTLPETVQPEGAAPEASDKTNSPAKAGEKK